MVGPHRLGIKPFVHDEVRALSLHSSGVGDLMEIVDLWNKRTTHNDEPWSGTSTAWYAEIMTDKDICSLVSKMNPRAIGKRFSEAAQIRDSGITVARTDTKHGNIYQIERLKK